MKKEDYDFLVDEALGRRDFDRVKEILKEQKENKNTPKEEEYNLIGIAQGDIYSAFAIKTKHGLRGIDPLVDIDMTVCLGLGVANRLQHGKVEQLTWLMQGRSRARLTLLLSQLQPLQVHQG